VSGTAAIRRTSLAGAAALLLPLAGCLCAGCGESREPIETFVGQTMGTTYRVSYAPGVATPALVELQDEVDALLVEVSRQMSTYDPASELSRFNRHEGDEWFPVSPWLSEVVAYSLVVARDSGGAFDPTVGPVLKAWGFGPGAKKRRRPPSNERLLVARQSVGYALLESRLKPPALRKRQPGVTVELSAVAPGFAVDKVSDLLAERGATASMVEIGGEVVGRGLKPGGKPWRIGVEPADPGADRLQAVVELRDRAVTTSGDYRNYFLYKGERYSHTIDPRTGRPVEHGLATVTVFAPTCREADATATVLMVLGPEAGYSWAQERGLAAMFVTRDDAVDPPTYSPKCTTTWPDASVTISEKTP
jgi:thiamine biosynthesis lipoprotein